MKIYKTIIVKLLNCKKMKQSFKDLIKDLSTDNSKFVVDIIDSETNITLYKKQGKELMLKHADTIEDWFKSLATKHKVDKIEVIKFKTCKKIYQKMLIIDIIYAKESYKDVRKHCLEKLNREYEDSKRLQDFFMQQFKMYLNDKCSLEELKRAGQIVTTEMNNR